MRTPSRTVSVERKRSGLFQVMRDSVRVTFVLLRFYLSSLIATATAMRAAAHRARRKGEPGPTSRPLAAELSDRQQG